MMPMSMHYDDAEADFPLTNPRGRLDYQDYRKKKKPDHHIVSNLRADNVTVRMTYFFNWRDVNSFCTPTPHLTIKPRQSVSQVNYILPYCLIER